MHHELHDLEVRVLRLDRTIQGLSLAKTVLPAIHNPGPTTHAEIFAADESLDAIEQKIEELRELMRQMTTPFNLRDLSYRRRQGSPGAGQFKFSA